MTDILQTLTKKSQEESPKILLPEADDERVLQAAVEAHDRGIAQPVLFNDEAVRQTATALDVDINEFELIDVSDLQLDAYVETYANLRSVTHKTARELLRDKLVLSGLLARIGEVDSFVAGAVNETAAVIAVANGVVGLDPSVDTGSSFFIMIFDDPAIGEDGVLLYADCGVNIAPSTDQLADIAIATANTADQLLDWDPKVAMLSFSTKGSANHETVQKVQTVTEQARGRDESLRIDGEMQADAALVPAVAERKTGGTSPLKGDANVLIFPDLQAGNIAYKLSERLGGATALGPILQGYARPISDLSRGASTEDIVDVLTVTAARVASDPGVNNGKIITRGALKQREERVTEELT